MRTSTLWPALVVAAASTLAFFAWRAGAQSAAPAPKAPTVALVNLERLLNNLDELQTRRAEVEAMRAELQKGIDSKGADLEKIGNALKILPAGTPDYKAKQQEAVRKRVEMEVDTKIAEQLMDQKRAEIQKALFLKIQDAVSRMAKQRGYALVFSHDGEVEVVDGQEAQITRQIAVRRILYAEKELDISEELLTMMNNEWKAGAKPK